jgi:hypothetical protein
MKVRKGFTVMMDAKQNEDVDDEPEDDDAIQIMT